MNAVSKIQASLASATQETTIALASLNFDFSLFKVEAPPTYKPLGAALSLQRRSAAENGMPHVIARRLGSLFETLLPSTPSLVNAYGARASEISESPGVNPPGSKDHGPFRKFVGLDGTSIWAAATSGPSAVAVHLLACMLARVWSPAEAVSIWEELVTERKRALVPDKDADSIPTRDIVAAHLSIDKEQLAEWDASARAWLRTADASTVTRKQQKELITLLSSVSMPVGSQPMVYDSVCKAWVTALSTIDKLVQGHPYSAQDGAVLVALSSWHLYPDVIVLGLASRELCQRDPLIANGGVLTVGLQTSDPEASQGVHWSLSLAHLRYYGSPVLTRAAVDAESSRLTFPQFLLVSLGALIASWGLPTSQISNAAKLAKLMKSSFSRSSNQKHASGHTASDWFSPLISAASQHLAARGEELDASSKLIRLGHRRQSILSQSAPSGVFHLLSLDLICVMRTHEQQVDFFRSIFQHWKPPDITLILRIGRKGFSEYGFSTVTPTSSAAKESERTYMSYVPKGVHEASWGMPQDRASPYEREDVVFGASGREFVWKNAPAFAGSAVGQVVVEDENASPRKDRPRWPLRVRKDTNSTSPRKESPAFTFEFVGGDVDGVSLYCLKGHSAAVRHFGDSQVNLRVLMDAFSNKTIDATRLTEHFSNLAKSYDSTLFQSCLGIAYAAQLYESLPGATISPKVFASPKPIAELPWASELLASGDQERNAKYNLTRAVAFSCIAYFESGVMEVPPTHLQNVMAISSGDSLYVAAQLLCDPAANVKPYEIHRVIGNIGRAGLAFLIPPQSPMVRPPNSDSWTLVNHQPFDGKLENNFGSTTLHLGFSGYEFPMTFGDHGGRFVEAFFIEAVVSVHDSGRWIADLDVLSAMEASQLYSLVQQPTCKEASPAGRIPEVEVISLDNWEELLDPPRSASVVRAHGNWQARLAAANVSVMLGHPTILFRGHGCWTCAVKVMEGFQHSQPERQTTPFNTYDNGVQMKLPQAECVFVL